MDNELIQLFFDPATENIDWEKRKPRNKPQINKPIKQEKDIKQTQPERNVSIPSKMTEDFAQFIASVSLKADEYKKSGSKELLKQLENDYTVLCVNFEHFGKPQEMTMCIKKVLNILRVNTGTLKIIKKNDKQKRLGMSDRGIQIHERLSEIKYLIKKDLSSNELHEIKKELSIYKDELTNNISIFSKADNIQIRLSQIENYLNKIAQKNITTSKLQENEEEIVQSFDDKTQNGQTLRGIEIQEELASLRDEVKRKDLNPIEKENLTNALLKLQNEITIEMDKFSKFDSIPIRLNQIENYLEKLNDKKEKASKSVNKPKKEIEEDKKEDSTKKQKKQVIWKFGL